MNSIFLKIYMTDLRMFYTKFRLSSHKFLIERARWHKTVIPYHEKTCTLCNQHDIQDEYHVALICGYFKNLREKYMYIQPYYYITPTMIKFIELMNTPNCKERFRMMLFLKLFLNYTLKLSGRIIKH